MTNQINQLNDWVLTLAPEHGLNVAALLHKADAALYAAKQSGKGRVRFYRKSMHAETVPSDWAIVPAVGI